MLRWTDSSAMSTGRIVNPGRNSIVTVEMVRRSLDRLDQDLSLVFVAADGRVRHRWRVERREAVVVVRLEHARGQDESIPVSGCSSRRSRPCPPAASWCLTRR